jgi:hypothetical protein
VIRQGALVLLTIGLAPACDRGAMGGPQPAFNGGAPLDVKLCQVVVSAQQWTDESDGRTLPSFVTDELHDFLGAVAHINAFWACQVRWQAEDLRPGSPAKRARAAGSTCEPEARRTDFAWSRRRWSYARRAMGVAVGASSIAKASPVVAHQTGQNLNDIRGAEVAYRNLRNVCAHSWAVRAPPIA